MSFFESDLVQEEMKEIESLQNEIYTQMFNFASMNKEDKLYHIDLLDQLLKKQKVMYTRLSLSDDPAAKEMKENILKSAHSLGFEPGTDLGYIFGNMSVLVDNMRKSLSEQD